MKTFIGSQDQTAENFVRALLVLRPSIAVLGNKLQLVHKQKDLSISLTKAYASKSGYTR